MSKHKIGGLSEQSANMDTQDQNPTITTSVPGWKHQSIGAEQHLYDNDTPRVYNHNVMTLCFLKVDGY